MGTIRLYQVDFEPRDNFYIEDIETYLSGLPSTSKRFNSDKLNYLKLSMNLELKLPLDQVMQVAGEANYAVITQDDTNYYYFVVDARWVARKTVALRLMMDTVQTFFKKLSWSKRTQIVREHRDRVKKFSGTKYIRVIDKFTEGMNPALVSQENTQKILDSTKNKWYLVYMTNPGVTQESTSEPMLTGIISSFPYRVENAIANPDVTITAALGNVLYFTDTNIGEGAYVQIGSQKVELDALRGNKVARAIEFLYGNYVTGISYRLLYYTGDTYPYSFAEYSDWKSYSTDQLTVHNIRSCAKLNISTYYKDNPEEDYNSIITNLDSMDSLKNTSINAGTVPAVYLTSYANFDNSNSRLYKIIELPYAPIKVSMNEEGNYEFENCDFVYGYNILKFKGDIFKIDIATDAAIQDVMFVDIPSPTATDEPNMGLESKLYSSEFYDFSYVYDTDRIRLRLEDFNFSDNMPAITISYAQTNTMNSDRQFRLTPLNCSYNSNSLWELYLNSSRNTEKLILNSSYADYIRNGYNYDQWSQKRSAEIARFNTIINGVGSAFSIGSAAISTGMKVAQGVKQTRQNYNQAVAKAGQTYGKLRDTETYINDLAFSFSNEDWYEGDAGATLDRWERERSALATQYAAEQEAYRNIKSSVLPGALRDALSAVTSIGGLVIGSGINSFASAHNAAVSIETGRQSLINSVNSRSAGASLSASGNVPVDLFNNYCENKLIRSEFTVRWIDKKNIYDTLRYLGYSHPVQEIPDFSSRIYSNFVQCTPAFDNEQTEVYKVYLDDITQRFQAGVTVKHCYKGKYDLHDEYENYETIVMED